MGKNRKKDSKLLFTSHTLIKKSQELINSINLDLNDIWFKQKPMILHVCCRNINSANHLWRIVHLAGYKRGGIRKGKGWYNIEIIGSEFIEAPIKEINKKYIQILIKEGNKRMKKSFSRMRKFEKILEELQ